MKSDFLKILCVSVLAALLCSCAIHQDRIVSREITKPELQEHVRFLSSRYVGGRGVLTRGSRRARNYIACRFREIGLEPAGEKGGYLDSFFLGANVVGYIEGSDPKLKNEAVVLSAHYDHLPKEKKGAWYPGADDNATGVAALIETAEHIARLERTPRRTIIFVAFDGEEVGLLGSHHFLKKFTLKGKQLVASVNLDMLGREFFDCVGSTIFAMGTDTSDEMRKILIERRKSTDLDVLFLGSDLVGPIGDYYNFKLAAIPSVMLSTGWHRDYHKPTDTWDKIDYELLLSSARLTKDVILALAGSHSKIHFAGEERADREELKTVLKITGKILERAGTVSLDEHQIARLKSVNEKAQKLASEREYSQKERELFAIEVQQTLFPIFIPEAPPEGFATVIQFAKAFPGLIRDVYDQLDSKVEGRRFKNIFELRDILKDDFSYFAMEIANDQIKIIERDDALMISFILGYVFIKSPEDEKDGWAEVSFGFNVNNFEGTKRQLIEYFILRWNYRQKEFKTARLNVYPKLLKFLTGEDFGDDFEKWKEWFMAKSGIASQKEWVLASYESGNLNCRLAAIDNLPRYFPGAWADYCIKSALDVNEEGPVRREALSILEENLSALSKEQLERLLPLLDDDTFVESRNAQLTMMENHPLSGKPLFETAKMIMEKTLPEERRKPDSPLRLNYRMLSLLQKATGKKYGLNTKKWKRYLRSKRGRISGKAASALER